jgi:hypothetical protein
MNKELFIFRKSRFVSPRKPRFVSHEPESSTIVSFEQWRKIYPLAEHWQLAFNIDEAVSKAMYSREDGKAERKR